MSLPDAVMVRYNKLSIMEIPSIGRTIVMTGPQKGEHGHLYGLLGLEFNSCILYSMFSQLNMTMNRARQLYPRLLFKARLVLRFLFRDYFFNMGNEIISINVEHNDGLPNFADGCKVYGDNYNLEANLIAFVLDLKLNCRDEPAFELKDFCLSLVIDYLGGYNFGFDLQLLFLRPAYLLCACKAIALRNSCMMVSQDLLVAIQGLALLIFSIVASFIECARRSLLPSIISWSVLA